MTRSRQLSSLRVARRQAATAEIVSNKKNLSAFCIKSLDLVCAKKQNSVTRLNNQRKTFAAFRWLFLFYVFCDDLMMLERLLNLL